MGGRRQAAERRSLAAKTVMTTEMRESVLAQAARDVAVKDIRASLGTHRPSLSLIYQVIREAKAMHDPASVKPRKPRQPKPAPPAEVDRPVIPTRAPGQVLDGWWFAAETVVVTRLGHCSTDCARVPVSVSAVPSGRPVKAISEGVVRVSVHRSLSEAMAAHALARAPQPHDGHPQSEPARPHQPR